MDILAISASQGELKELIEACKFLEVFELKSLESARYDYLLYYKCYN